MEMRKVTYVTVFMLIWMLCPLFAFAAKDGLVAWWKFDDAKGKAALDSVSRVEDEILGNFKFVRGSSGTALSFDGFSTSIVRKAAKAPRLGRSFSIEAWVALGAYPWNWCPIISQADQGKTGYYFGIDSQGLFGLSLKVDDEWITCKSGQF